MGMFGGLSSLSGVGDIVAYIKLSGSDQFNNDLNKLNIKSQEFSNSLKMAMNVSIIAAGAALIGAAKSAIEFESSFAGVLKTTDGLTDEFGKINDAGIALGEQFRKLALEVPLSVNELNRIGELGGQLGVAKGDLLIFTKVIAELGSTTNLSFEQGATQIAQFVNNTRSVVPAGTAMTDQFERIASALVDLGNKSVATEAGIMEMSLRLSGAGALVGMTQPQILSFAAALSSVGVEAEAGGTAFQRLFINIKSNIETGGAKLAEFANVAGLSVADFKREFETNAAEAVIKFIEGLSNIQKSGGSVITVLNDLELSDVRLSSAILRAASAGDLFRDTLKTGEQAYRDNTAMAEEYRKRLETTEAQLKLLKNAVNDILISLGQQFLPVIKDVAESLAKHPEIISGIITLIIGTGGIVLAYKAWSAAHTAWVAIGTSEKFIELANSINFSRGGFLSLISTWGSTIVSAGVLAGALGGVLLAIKTMDDIQKIYDNTDKQRLINLDAQRAFVEKMIATRKAHDAAVTENIRVATEEENQRNRMLGILNQELEKWDLWSTALQTGTMKMRDSSNGTSLFADKAKLLDDQLKSLGITYVELDPEFIKQIDATEKQRDAASKATLSWKDYGSALEQIIGRMPGVNSTTKELIGTLVALASPGTGWLTIATQAVGFLISALTGTGDQNKYVDLTTEEVISSMGKFGETIKTTQENLKSLNADYNIPLLEMLDAQIKKLTDDYTWYYNAQRRAVQNKDDAALIIEYARQMDLVGEQLRVAESEASKFNTAINAMNNLFINLESELSTKFIKAFGYSGGMTSILTDQIPLIEADREKWSDLMDKAVEGSPYWIDLAKSFTLADYALQLANGTVKTATDYINLMGLDVEQATWLLEHLGTATDKATGSVVKHAESWSSLGTVIKNFSNTATPAMYDWLYFVNQGASAATLTSEAFKELYREGFKSTEQIIADRKGWEAMLPVLKQGSREWKFVTGEIEKCNTELGINSKEFDLNNPKIILANRLVGQLTNELNKNKAAQEALDIELAKATKIYDEQIVKLKGLISSWQDQLDAINVELEITPKVPTLQNIEQKIKPLQEWLDNFNGVIKIQTVADIQADIEKWQNEIDAINLELNPIIVPPTLQDIQKNIDDLNAKIAGSEQTRVQILSDISDLDVKYQTQVSNIAAAWRDLNFQINAFKIVWGEMTGQIVGNFDVLFGDSGKVKQAIDALDRLKYFKIGFDTTDADESINALIVSTQEYLAQLNPSSTAYTDAKTALDALMLKFKAMGGVVSTEQALNFNTEQAGLDIAGITDAYLIEKGILEENLLKVNLDLIQFGLDMDALKIDYDARVALLEATKINLQIDISAGLELVTAQLEQWKIDYDVRLAYLNSQRIELIMNIDQANYGLDVAKRNFETTKADIEAQQVRLRMDATDLNYKLYYANYELDRLTKNPHIVKVTYQSNAIPTIPAQHTDGMLRAHTGAMLGSSSGLREIPFIGLENEMVLKPEVTQKFGADRLEAFNASLNPAALMSGQVNQEPMQLTIVSNITAHETTPKTWYEISKANISPSMRKISANTVKSGAFKR